MAPSKGYTPWNKGLISECDTRVLAGRKHPMYGKHHRPKTKEKMRKNHWSKKGVQP